MLAWISLERWVKVLTYFESNKRIRIVITDIKDKNYRSNKREAVITMTIHSKLFGTVIKFNGTNQCPDKC